MSYGGREVIIDPWSFYDYKEAFGLTRGGIVVPTWVGDHTRRLRAYKLLESYYRNKAREWLNTSVDDETKKNRREYGDPRTIVDQALASLLGHDQSLIVPLANGDNSEPDAEEALAVLLNWWRDEQVKLKIIECERNAVKLGDGVYVLGWNEKLGRPRLQVWDPGFYFPVLDAADASDDYPRKCHIAYEFEEEDATRKVRRYVRRITWELVELDGTRSLPWNDEPTNITCLYSDGTWLLGDAKEDPDVFNPARAAWAVDAEGNVLQEFDLGIDFIPVIHIPNTPPGQEHFGTSVLASVLQVFDDLQSTDTDLQAASATTGTPPLVLSGASAPKDDEGNTTSYGPGTVFETGDGSATMIDTSRSLDALLKYDEHLLERLSVNSRTPEALLGRVKPNEVPSGIALTLSFTPHSSMIREMRLVRETKYALLLKFVLRYFILSGDVADVFEAQVAFGSFLPADKQEVTTIAVQLLAARAVSLETAVRMMIEAGFPIEDAVREVALINAGNFEAANQLLDATGDPIAVRNYLNMGPLPDELLTAIASPPPPTEGGEEL